VEERHLQRLVHGVVDAQLRKVELKLNQLDELEGVLEAERREIERQRQQLFLDRLTVQKALLGGGEAQPLAFEGAGSSRDSMETDDEPRSMTNL
jgi:SWI/SNF related-matrix-associated actin-dependent regulator of chromatin subfamily C